MSGPGIGRTSRARRRWRGGRTSLLRRRRYSPPRMIHPTATLASWPELPRSRRPTTSQRDRSIKHAYRVLSSAGSVSFNTHGHDASDDRGSSSTSTIGPFRLSGSGQPSLKPYRQRADHRAVAPAGCVCTQLWSARSRAAAPATTSASLPDPVPASGTEPLVSGSSTALGVASWRSLDARGGRVPGGLELSRPEQLIHRILVRRLARRR
jgi:hypothetical protein